MPPSLAYDGESPFYNPRPPLKDLETFPFQFNTSIFAVCHFPVCWLGCGLAHYASLFWELQRHLLSSVSLEHSIVPDTWQVDAQAVFAKRIDGEGVCRFFLRSHLLLFWSVFQSWKWLNVFLTHIYCEIWWISEKRSYFHLNSWCWIQY